MANLGGDTEIDDLPSSERSRVRRRSRKLRTKMVVDNRGLVKQQLALRDRALRRQRERSDDEISGLDI
jgi:hypothetical protein